VSAPLSLRVMVLDSWDEVLIEADPNARVAEVKEQALAQAQVTRPPDSFLVKHHGWEVSETATLADAGIGPNAALIILPRRRQPVR